MPNKNDLIKTVRARTAKEALALARARYGEDALVLYTNTRWKLLEKFGLSWVEVGVLKEGVSRAIHEEEAQDHPPAAYGRLNGQETFSVLKEDLTSLKHLLEKQTLDREAKDVLADTPELLDLFHALAGQGMHTPSLLDTFRSVLKDFDAASGMDTGRFKEALLYELKRHIRARGPLKAERGHRKLIVFIGPTGVGKTTTMAKLAADQSLNHDARVAFLAMDTYRIAAVEQLRIYAKIIGAPIEVVNDPQEIEGKLSLLPWSDFVFVDTAGRSPYDEPRILELRALKPNPNVPLRQEVVMVLSATTAYDELIRGYEAFSVLPIDGVIVTKLDETRRFGDVWRFLAEKKIPVSYLAFGQKVPDDIVMATPEMLTRALLEGKIRP